MHLLFVQNTVQATNEDIELKLGGFSNLGEHLKI